MFDNIVNILTWSLFLTVGVGTTAHLHRQMGVLVASQPGIMILAALIDVSLLKAGLPSELSWLSALIVGCLLGLLHLPVLLQTGPMLLFILTALGHFFLVEAWYAAPDVTGGSGGILLPADLHAGGAMLALVILTAFAAIYIYSWVNKPTRHFDWVCLRAIGTKAESFGVHSHKLYTLGFLFYGSLNAAAGVAATRFLGYLTGTSFGLTWALVIVMIVLASPRRPVVGSLILIVTYSTFRVMLRQTGYVSVTWSTLFDILFPLILLIAIYIQSRKPTESTASLNT